MFRSLGLRFICIVTSDGELKGVVTRKDLMRRLPNELVEKPMLRKKYLNVNTPARPVVL